MFAEGPKPSSLTKANRFYSHLQMKKQRSGAGSGEREKMLSLTSRPELHVHDFQLSKGECREENRRGEAESAHVGKIHYEPDRPLVSAGRCHRTVDEEQAKPFTVSGKNPGR